MKRMYCVCNSAEGEDYGYVFLTPEEAAIVEYAADKANWINRGGDGWGGSFRITDATIEAIMDACDPDNPHCLCAECEAEKYCCPRPTVFRLGNQTKLL